MKPKTIFIGILISAVCSALSLHAQPAFEGPPPSREVLQSADQRNAAYAARINEVLDWRIGLAKPETLDMATIAMLLVRNQDIELCNQRVIEMMKEPGTGPFWMFPSTIVAFAGRDKLSPEAQASIRNAWRTERQLRGDTENHWVMYHTSMYLMSELYPNEPAVTWSDGKSSE